MRFAVSISIAVFLSAVLCSAQSPEGLVILVNDPQGAVVAGARVALLQGKHVIAVQSTSAEGAAVIPVSASGSFAVQVLAPGFAPAAVALPPGAREFRVTLTVAAAPATVVTTATMTPIAEQESGAAIASLDANDLLAMQPIAASEALRFLPGAVVNTVGQRGGQASLFVRGGESRYNKVIIDGVPVNEPGGFFDFGAVPMQNVDRLEFLRGAESTLYGSDAMSSVVQLWSATGRTRTPEFRFGADGGNFSTAHGFASLAGARGRFDYDLFADQFNTAGQGPNDDYSNSSQGGNVGVELAPKAFLRARVRHANSRSGAQDAWKFNGAALLAPDIDQRARQDNLLGSLDLTISAPGQWQHRFSGFDYSHRRLNVDAVPDRGCDFAKFIFRDCGFNTFADYTHGGFEYQGDYNPRSWARTTFGYVFEDEHGDNRDLSSGASTAGLRRNHALYGQQLLTWSRGSLTAGLRYVHNESFGNKVVPRVTGTWLLRRGDELFSATRLRGVFAQGIKAPDFIESFGEAAFGILPNPALKAEENRSLEAGIMQGLMGDRIALSATYFNDLFHNRINFQSLGPPQFLSQFVNVDRALAHGAELELHARIRRGLGAQAAYDYTSTQILRAPLSPSTTGQPLLRRPRHLGSVLLTYSGKRWGGDLGGSFVGRRPDSDFQGFNINHAAGYARVDIGGWFAVNRFATAYVNVGNTLDKNYNEVLGFPAPSANFRAGVRFRIGGE
jgi:vitamin B12 transporter